MKKTDLKKLKALHTSYISAKKDAESRKDFRAALIWEAKAAAVCDVLAALDGIPYTQAVEKIIEN